MVIKDDRHWDFIQRLLFRLPGLLNRNGGYSYWLTLLICGRHLVVSVRPNLFVTQDLLVQGVIAPVFN